MLDDLEAIAMRLEQSGAYRVLRRVAAATAALFAPGERKAPEPEAHERAVKPALTREG